MSGQALNASASKSGAWRVRSVPRASSGSNGRGSEALPARWKDLTDNVNSMASNLTRQVRTSLRSATAIARQATWRERSRSTFAVKFFSSRKPEHDGRTAAVVRFGSHACALAKSAPRVGWVCRPSSWRGRNLEGSDRFRQCHGVQT